MKRLHPSTLWLPLLETLVRAIMPGFVAVLFLSLGSVLTFGLWFVLVPTALFYVARYFTFRYTVAEDEIVLTTTLFGRYERRIPLHRIQDARIQQGPLHRLLGLAKIELKTAGSEETEASLNVVDAAEAERLREHLGSCQARESDEGGVRVVTGEQHLLHRLSPRDLLLGGLTSNLIALLTAVIGAIVSFKFLVSLSSYAKMPNGLAQQLEPSLTGLGWLGGWGRFILDDTLARSLVLAFGGFLVSLVAFAGRYYGYRLTRTRGVLTKTHGWANRRQSSVARSRIQALKVEATWLRRRFGLATIRVDSAGNRGEAQEGEKREVLVPIITTTAADRLIPEVLPGWSPERIRWRPISAKSVLRGSRIGWLVLLTLTLQTCLATGWHGLYWLLAAPLVYYVNYQLFRHTHYHIGRDFVSRRRGWLSRETVHLPVKSIQNVSLHQSYFDRRLNLATLSIDIAGSTNTGGGPVLRHLPARDARRLQRTLARRIADLPFMR